MGRGSPGSLWELSHLDPSNFDLSELSSKRCMIQSDPVFISCSSLTRGISRSEGFTLQVREGPDSGVGDVDTIDAGHNRKGALWPAR